MKPIRLKVNTLNQKYQIIIGNNILNNIQKLLKENSITYNQSLVCLLYTSPSPRDAHESRMPSSA